VVIIVVIIGVAFYLKDRFDFNLERVESSIDISGVQDQETEPESPIAIPEDKELKLRVGEKSPILTVKTARTSQEQEEGLMFVEEISNEEGMLFVYEKDTKAKFWMKNCKIPLDIIFIDKYGKIVHIVKDAQPCKTDLCQLYGSDSKYRYALEVDGGWSEKYRINKGDKITIITNNE
jgi:hypothetical protein